MTPDTLSVISTFIATVGFPIAVTCYLLVVFRKSLDANTTATITLTELIRAWMLDENRYQLTEAGRQALLRHDKG